VDLNPFDYSDPVEPKDLIDREPEVGTLLRLATGAHNTRLSAPRRFGKTSVLRRVLQDARGMGRATVYVNFYGVTTLEEVAVRIERAYREQLQGPLRRAAVAAIDALRPTGRLSVAPGIGFEIHGQRDRGAAERLLGLLDLPIKVAQRSGGPVIVAFDEFQEVLSAGGEVDKLIRSRIEHHGQAAGYVFAGSHPGLMAELFGERQRALFEQARPVPLGPLPDAELAGHIGERFERTGRRVEGVLDALLALVRGHPQRAMLAAHHLWEATPADQTADEERWASAREGMFTELEEGFERTWSGLSRDQRRLMSGVAEGEGTLFAARTLQRHQLSKAGAQHARDTLVAQGVLEASGGSAQIVDPLLEVWIAAGRRRP
jgi:hypothetical protein